MSQSLDDIVADMAHRIAEIERRARNRKRTGKVSEVGTGENAGKYKVQLSEQGAKPFVTDWIKARPLAAGGLKIDVMHTVGEQVDVVSENGDLTDAVLDLSTYGDDNKRGNSNDEPFHLGTGDTTLTINGSTVTITAPNVIVNSPNVQLGGEGGKRVARIGDMVEVQHGSSAGRHPIIEGSSSVFATD